MKFTHVATLSILSPVVFTSPTPAVQERSTQICGQWDTVAAGDYTIYQDLWGEDNASSGSQCTTFDSVSSGTVKWSTSWTWAGGSSDVKSYANAALTISSGVKISTITSIPSVWKWRYSLSS
jgi:xyloglucan-specific endo-beta-1,4-glucanase